MPGDLNLLEPHSGRVGGFVDARNCVWNSVQTVHTDCTPVQANNFCTGAVDWARVGGVVHESVGVCMNDMELWKPKYMPDWDHLPVWVHPAYKPECSKRQKQKKKIYVGKDNETLSHCQYLPAYLSREENITYRRGRGLEGMVGMAVRRLEGGGGQGGESIAKERSEGGKDKECKLRKECVGVVTASRIVRRGGRVSNFIKTLEEGSKQQNKIVSYFSKPGGRMDSGHPLAITKLCDSGTKRRKDESENVCDGVSMGSAHKRARGPAITLGGHLLSD